MAMELREKVKYAAGRYNEDRWVLAELLHQVNRKGSYFAWGYGTWREYLSQELSEISIRQAQYLMALWDWYLELPADAQQWARKNSFSLLRRLRGLVTAENWREWAGRRPLTCTEADNILRDRGAWQKGELMDMRARRLWEETRNLGLEPEQHMALLRSMGLTAEHTATLLGVTPDEVRGALRLVQAFIPATTLERAIEYADADGRPVDAEVCLVLQQLYDPGMPKLGMWEQPAKAIGE